MLTHLIKINLNACPSRLFFFSPNLKVDKFLKKWKKSPFGILGDPSNVNYRHPVRLYRTFVRERVFVSTSEIMFAHTSNHDLSTGECLPKVASEDLTCQSSLFHLLLCVGRQSKQGFMSSCLFQPIPQAKSRGCYPKLSRALRRRDRFQTYSPYRIVVQVSFFLSLLFPSYI